MSSEFDVTAVITAIRAECSKDIEEVNKAISEAGKAALDDLLANSPVDTSPNAKIHMGKDGKLHGTQGAYRKGWEMSTSTKNGVREVRVYNRTHYQLTHLLENGHLAREGSFVKPVPHIKNAEDKAYEKLEELLK